MIKQKFHRPTVTSNVVEYVTNKILSGELKGGAQIRQEALADEIGVSRVPVREALLQLEAEGLVNIMTHKGAVVVPLSIENAVDVFEAREVLEYFIIEKAVERANEADYERIGAALAAYDKGILQKAPPAQLSHLNWQFHVSLLEPSARPRSVSVIRTLYTSLDRYLRIQIRTEVAQAAAVADHGEIFDAYTSRDFDKVLALTKRHIQSAYEDVLEGLHDQFAGIDT